MGMKARFPRIGLPIGILLLELLAGGIPGGIRTARGDEDGIPEVRVGRRLFLETRFSQFFYAHSGGRTNEALPAGDPVVAGSLSPSETLPGPYSGRSINCRACHLVNEHEKSHGLVRAYTDYARRSPVPDRGDGGHRTPRRSPVLVDSTLDREVPILLHYDGEFASIEDLVRGTLTGRNFGWLPEESSTAVRHIADVIRRDDGSDLFGRGTAGLPYSVLLQGTGRGVAPFIRISPPYRLDVRNASDPEILSAVARLIGVYVDSLRYSAFTPPTGARFAGSPYDVFLTKNGLPARPDPGESARAYARRLRGRLETLGSPSWVTSADWRLRLHPAPYGFGPREFEGLRVFLREPEPPRPAAESGSKRSVGNCVACHVPPAFTDFSFHNTGASQEEYDAVHGEGAFERLPVPSLSRRRVSPDLYLPAGAAQPLGKGPFRSVPSASDPGLADLGLWNIFANDACPGPQDSLRKLLGTAGPPTDADLASTLALIKTPTVRDPGQSGPYFHTGRKDTLTEVLRHYRRFSDLARAGRVRNGDSRLRGILLTEDDLPALEAFLRSLNEDYND